MMPSLVKNREARVFALALVLLVVLASVSQCAAKKCGVICRVRDPLAIGQSQTLKECLYEVYPVESTQNDGGMMVQSDDDSGRNRLFALYGGASSCEYFGNMIQTAKGRETLTETILKQLHKSRFNGLDLQCDPSQAHVSQQTYSDFLELLRNRLGSTYVIMVTMSSCQPGAGLINSLNSWVDYVTIEASAQQSQVLTNALLQGLARHRVLLGVAFPATVQCPLNCDHSLTETLNHVDNHNLFGAVVQLDRDDIYNMCGEGAFPLFRKVLDRLCTDAECNFKGFVRDTRDCGRFTSCTNGHRTSHHCPVGQAFDLCKSSCQPFLTVNCNSTTCEMCGELPQGMMPIVYPMQFPNPSCTCCNNPGCSNNCNNNCACNCGNNGCNNGCNCNNGGNNNGCNNNGCNNNGCNNNGGNSNNNNNNNNNNSGNQDCSCDVLKNLTLVLKGTEQLSQLDMLLSRLKLNDTLGMLNSAVIVAVPLVEKTITELNALLAKVLLGQQVLDNSTNGLQKLDKNAGLLENLIHQLLHLVRSLLEQLGLVGKDGLLGILKPQGVMAGGPVNSMNNTPGSAVPTVGAVQGASGDFIGLNALTFQTT